MTCSATSGNGYGAMRILPNSTTVRLVVIGQIMIGYPTAQGVCAFAGGYAGRPAEDVRRSSWGIYQHAAAPPRVETHSTLTRAFTFERDAESTICSISVESKTTAAGRVFV